MASSTHSSKIRTLEELADIIQAAKEEGKTVVHCHGVFDLLHPGHVRHFQAARKEGDILVVTLTPDHFVNKGPGRPVFSEQLRAEFLAALADIDYVAINRWPTAVETIRMLKPGVYVKGDEYERREDDLTGKITDEEQAVLDSGGRIHFTHDVTFSSTKLLNEHFAVFSPETKMYLQSLKEKHTLAEVIAALQNLKSLKVLVVGDTIIDEYVRCKVLGRASKSAALNTRFVQTESYAGGAVAVANHIAGLCENVDFVTVLGAEEPQQDFLTAHLGAAVTPTFFLRSDGPTTVKRRFVEPFLYQKMFEVTFIQDRPLPDDIMQELNAHLEKVLPQYDLVIVADFGHGMLRPETIRLLCEKSRFLALNVQINSANTGFNPLTKYPRADYLCVDQEEMRFAYHDRFGPMNTLMKHAAGTLQCRMITVTQGDQGSLTWKMDDASPVQTPVFASRVIDTIGAGDAFLSFAAPCAAAGYSPEIVGLVGNAAGALAAQILGNKEPVNPVALLKFITTLLK